MRNGQYHSSYSSPCPQRQLSTKSSSIPVEPGSDHLKRKSFEHRSSDADSRGRCRSHAFLLAYPTDSAVTCSALRWRSYITSYVDSERPAGQVAGSLGTCAYMSFLTTCGRRKVARYIGWSQTNSSNRHSVLPYSYLLTLSSLLTVDTKSLLSCGVLR